MTKKMDKARARQAKGSVQEAMGTIIGDPAVQPQGRRESDGGARQVKSRTPIVSPEGGDGQD